MDGLIEQLPLLSKIASSGVLVAIAVGVYFRRRPKVHIPIMISCFVVDTINVLVIELNRSAIQKAIETTTVPGEWLLKFHIAVSVISMACYFVALYAGIKLYKSGEGRDLHRANAVVFLLTRFLNYVTSFGV